MRKCSILWCCLLSLVLPYVSHAQSTYSFFTATVHANGNVTYADRGTSSPRNEVNRLAPDLTGRPVVLGITGQHGGATQTDPIWLPMLTTGAWDPAFGAGVRIPDLVPNAPYVDPADFYAFSASAITPFGTKLTANYFAVISRARVSGEFRSVFSLHSQESGNLIDSFGTAGAVVLPTVPFDTYLIPYRVFLHLVSTPTGPAPMFLIAARNNSSTHPMAVVRLTATGQVDTTYGQGGIAKVPLNVPSGPSTTAPFTFIDADIDLNGRVVLLGARHDPTYNASPPKYDALLARIDASGQMDATFGASGIVNHALLTIQSKSVVGALKVGAYHIYVGGGQQDGTQYGDPQKAVVLRLKLDGTLDNAFGTSGRATYNSRFLTRWATTARRISISAAGRLVVALDGTLDTDPRPNYNPTKRRATVVRLLPTGAPDTTFGVGGEVNTTYVIGPDYHPNSDLYLKDMAVASSGVIYLGFTHVR